MFSNITPKKLSALLALTLAATALPPAHAANSDGTSKEDQHLEAQGDATGMLFNHGMGEVEYRTQFQSSGALGSVGLKIETAVLGPYDTDGNGSILVAPVPIEVRVVVDPAGSTIFAPERVRADVVKVMFPYIGLTLQGLGYSYERLQAGDARQNGVHFFEATLSEVVGIDGKGGSDFAITFKGNASIGMGTDKYPMGLPSEIQSDWRATNGKHYEGATMTEASGSIGLRIKQSVLIELFGGANQFSTPSTQLFDLEYGAKARVMIFDKKLQLTTSIAKQDSVYHGTSGTQNFDNGVRLVIGVEGHW